MSMIIFFFNYSNSQSRRALFETWLSQPSELSVKACRDFSQKFWVRSPAILIEKQYIDFTTTTGFPGYFLHNPTYLKS